MTTRRNSIRYPGYDYREAGCYLLTICTHERQRLFGQVADATMLLSSVGVAVDTGWRDIASTFPGVMVDAHIVMPDHLHGILFLGTDPLISAGHELSDVVRWLKNRVQTQYRYRVAAGEWAPYRGRLWHRSYHDRIIRSDRELEEIQAYIEGNPARWQERRNM